MDILYPTLKCTSCFYFCVCLHKEMWTCKLFFESTVICIEVTVVLQLWLTAALLFYIYLLVYSYCLQDQDILMCEIQCLSSHMICCCCYCAIYFVIFNSSECWLGVGKLTCHLFIIYQILNYKLDVNRPENRTDILIMWNDYLFISVNLYYKYQFVIRQSKNQTLHLTNFANDMDVMYCTHQNVSRFKNCVFMFYIMYFIFTVNFFKSQ